MAMLKRKQIEQQKFNNAGYSEAVTRPCTGTNPARQRTGSRPITEVKTSVIGKEPVLFLCCFYANLISSYISTFVLFFP